MSYKHISSVLLSLSVLFAASASADTVSLSADVTGNSVVVNVNFDFTPDSGVIDLTWDETLFVFDGFGATSPNWNLSGGSPYSDGYFGVNVNTDPGAATGVAFSFNLLATGLGEGAIGIKDNWSPDSSFYVNGSPQSVTFVGTTAEITAVPVPAAVWLFGSGLVGLAGVARRKAA